MTCIVIQNGVLAVESATTHSLNCRAMLTNKIHLVPGGEIDGRPIRAIVGTGHTHVCNKLPKLYQAHVWRISNGELGLIDDDNRLESFETKSCDFATWVKTHLKLNLGFQEATILAVGNAIQPNEKGPTGKVRVVRVTLDHRDSIPVVPGIMSNGHFGSGRFTTRELSAAFSEHNVTSPELVWLSTKLVSGCGGVVQTLDLNDPNSHVQSYVPTKKRKLQMISLLRKHILDELNPHPDLETITEKEDPT